MIHIQIVRESIARSCRTYGLAFERGVEQRGITGFDVSLRDDRNILPLISYR